MTKIMQMTRVQLLPSNCPPASPHATPPPPTVWLSEILHPLLSHSPKLTGWMPVTGQQENPDGTNTRKQIHLNFNPNNSFNQFYQMVQHNEGMS